MKYGQNNAVPCLVLCALSFLNVNLDKAFADVSVSTPAGAAISADTFGGTSTHLTGPVIDEGANQDIGVGTIVLHAPAGFQFDTRSNVVATVSRLDAGAGSLLVVNPTITVTVSNITLSVTAADRVDGTTLSRIAFSGISVQPAAGSPLAAGSITVTASPPIPGFTDGNVSASTNLSGPQLLSFGGQALFNPGVNGFSSGTAGMRQTGQGVIIDAGAVNGSAWAPYGSNMAALVFDWTGMTTTNWDPVANDAPHVGVVAQYINGNNFGGLVALNILSGQLQFAERNNRVETSEFLSITGGLQMNHPYRMQGFITNAPPANTNLLLILSDGLTGTVITNYTHHMDPSWTTNHSCGYQCLHAFAAAGLTLSNAVFAGDGTTLVSGGPQEWISLSGQPYPLIETLDNGWLTTTNSGSWKVDLSPVSFRDGDVSGYVSLSNGRIWGVMARATSAGKGYLFWYDNNNQQLRFGVLDSSGVITILQTLNSVTLNTGQTYFFRLNCRGQNMTFTVGGNTLSVTDGTLPDPGYLGLSSFSSTVQWQNLKYTPGTGITSLGALTEIPGAVARLAFTSQPAGGVYRTPLTSQPVVQVQDQFGNPSTNGLGSSLTVSVALTSGTGSLNGTTSLDIGSLAGNGTVTYTNLQTTAAGNGDAITASATGLASANSLPFNVTPVTVTGSITASNKVYDGNTTATLTGGSLSGVLGTDDVRLTGGSASFGDKNVGAGKTVTATGLTLTGAASGNYVLGSTTAATTAGITRRSLTVSATGINKVYDGTTAAAVTLSDNRVGGDAVSDSYTTASFADKNIGTGKTVSVSGLGIGGTDAPNYSLANTTASTSADITTAVLTVTANDLGRAYGATNPVLTVHYSGFVNGDTTGILSGSPALSTTAAANSPVGGSPYAITAAAGTLSAANYSFAFVSGNLTVSNAVLKVTANDQSRVYGAANPLLTAGYSGFVNGEGTNVLTVQVSLGTTATAASPVGSYPITASGIVASNYLAIYIQGTLTVVPPPPPPVAQAPILSGSGNVVISWSAASNSTYRVQYKNNLTDTNWTDLTPDVTATGSTASYTDHPGQVSQRFYRVILLP